MKKTGLILSIYFFVAAAYSALFILLVPVKNVLFFSGLIVALGGFAFSASITAAVNRNSTSVFPVSLSVSFVSAVYSLTVIGINFLFSFFFRDAVVLFSVIHIVGFTCYCMILALLLFAKKRIEKQNRSEAGRLCELQTILCEFEQIRIKLAAFPFPSARTAVKSLDRLLDALRFSAFSISGEIFDADSRLHTIAARISSEIDNLAAIGAEDFSGVEEMLRDTEKTIRDRDIQVRLLNRTI